MESLGITMLHTATGKYRYSLQEYCNEYKKLCPDHESLIDRLVQGCGIKTKYSCVDLDSLCSETSFADRNKMAQEAAWEMISLAINSSSCDLSSITHVVSSTSTLYGAPAIDAEIISKLPVPFNAQRFSLQAMGCTGGGAALSFAMNISKADKTARVLVICLDLCIPFVFKEPQSTNDVIGGVLFGDGCAIAIVESTSNPMLELIDSVSYTAPDTLDAMNIAFTDSGFSAQLSRTIDKQIASCIHHLVSQLPPISSTDKKRYLLHPGGKTILLALEKQLDTSAEYSWNVFANYGNMAAPTIFFVIQDYLQSGIKGEFVDCCCFGQGLYMVAIRMRS